MNWFHIETTSKRQGLEEVVTLVISLDFFWVSSPDEPRRFEW